MKDYTKLVTQFNYTDGKRRRYIRHIIVNFVNKKITIEDIEKDIISNCPKNTRAIKNHIGIWRKYLNFMDYDTLESQLDNISVDTLMEKYPKTKKFITEKDYELIRKQILKMFPANSLFFAVLFECTYEGIFGDGYEAYNELRQSGLNEKNNTVTYTLKDGTERVLEISPSLISHMDNLSEMDHYPTLRPYQPIAEVIGKYPDSVFKFNPHGDNDKGSSKFYAAQFTKIVQYMNIPKANDIFLSGIVNRVKKKLESEGGTFEDVLADGRTERAKKVMEYFKEECFRVHYPGKMGYILPSNLKKYILLYLETEDQSIL